jgi:hypothetical protein
MPYENPVNAHNSHIPRPHEQADTHDSQSSHGPFLLPTLSSASRCI